LKAEEKQITTFEDLEVWQRADYTARLRLKVGGYRQLPQASNL